MKSGCNTRAGWNSEGGVTASARIIVHVRLPIHFIREGTPVCKEMESVTCEVAENIKLMQ